MTAEAEVATVEQPKATKKTNEKKWSKPLMDAGYMVIPSIIFQHQRELGLDAVDINILLHLMRHWWFADNLPHPSKRLIADCMGIDLSTVRRHVARMEERGLILRNKRLDREDGQTSNSYDLTGLIEAVTPYALEAKAAKAAKGQKYPRHPLGHGALAPSP